MHSSTKKINAFEIYRAVAVSMVIIGHFCALQKDLPAIAVELIGSFTSYGIFIFFIISGFLLSASFASLLKNQSRYYLATKTFFIKRILRIYPAYVISLIIFSALLTNFFKYPVYWFDLLVHFFNIHNLFEGLNRSMNSVYWTLAVEFQWYIIAPVLIFLIIKTKTKTQIAILSGSIILSASIRYSVINDFINHAFTQAEMIRLGSDQVYIHLYNFIIGIIIYKWKDHKLNLPAPALSLLFLFVLFIGYIRADTEIMYYQETFRYKILIDYVGILALGFLLFAFKNFELHGKSYRILSFISLISYSLYIYHFPILHYVGGYNLTWYTALPVFLTFSIFISAISYYVVEAPFLKYSKRLSSG